MSNAPKKDPPHWLQVGDESWGPTDVRKRKPRPLPGPPPLPSVWTSENKAHSSMWAILAAIVIILLLASLMLWLNRYQ